jgi:hypothetical protein
MIEIFAVIAMAIVASGTAIFYVLLFLWVLKIFRGK